MLRVIARGGALVLACSLCGNTCKGLEIVRLPFVTPLVYADNANDFAYIVHVENYGNSTSSSSTTIGVQVQFTNTEGKSCGSVMHPYSAIGSLSPGEKWGSIGKTLQGRTTDPTACICKKGSCSGFVHFTLFTADPIHSGGKFVSGPASDIKVSFNQNGAVSYDVTPH